MLGPKRNSIFYTAQELALVELITRAVETRARTFVGRVSVGAPDASVFCCNGCFKVMETAESECLYCHSGDLESIDVPKLLVGRYDLNARVGVGGVGVVYEGYDIELERTVAIKTLPKMSLDRALELKNEARMMGKYSHPNLAEVYGVETVHGRPLMIMEYFRLGTLSQLLKSGQVLDAKRSLEELCSAVQWIHDKGLVHRDIKPDNIGIGEVNQLKLMDFGLGRLETERSQSIEEKGLSVSGSIAYMPPEAFTKGSNDKLADLWADCDPSGHGRRASLPG